MDLMVNKIKYLTQSEIKKLFKVIKKEGSIRDIAIFQLSYVSKIY